MLRYVGNRELIHVWVYLNSGLCEASLLVIQLTGTTSGKVNDTFSRSIVDSSDRSQLEFQLTLNRFQG